MLGWNETTIDPESELFLHDPLATEDDSASLLELGATPDAAIRWSYILDDGGSLIQELASGIASLRHTGWMLVA